MNDHVPEDVTPRPGQHERFHLKTLDALRESLSELGLKLPIDEHTAVLGEPVAIGPLEAPNRFVVNPMEGFDAGPDGAPQELSFRRYGRYARGGAGLIWFEATAVLQEARSNPGQLFIHAGNDNLVSSEEAHALHERAGEPKRLVIIPGATHVDFYLGDAFNQVTSLALEWYRTHLPLLDVAGPSDVASGR